MAASRHMPNFRVPREPPSSRESTAHETSTLSHRHTPYNTTNNHQIHPRTGSSGWRYKQDPGGQRAVMNSILQNHPFEAPHLLANRNRLSPSRSGMPSSNRITAAYQQAHLLMHHPPTDSFNVQSMSGRKRKASEEPDNDRMSTSPSASPSVSNRSLPSAPLQRSIKRTRTGAAHGRPLPLPRLLQTMNADDMRQLLQNVCDSHPELQQEIVTKAPRPSIDSALTVLRDYESAFQSAFPLGNRPTSDYAYNRVRQHLLDLIDALKDFTPHFLPPQETQAAQSLAYLDAATEIIHRLPDWDTYQHRRHKSDAYDEIGKAWALVIREAVKRAGGIQLQMGGWDGKVVEHDGKSGGRLGEAVQELRAAIGSDGGAGGGAGGMQAGGAGGVSDERLRIREQLFGGTFGAGLGVGQGRW